MKYFLAVDLGATSGRTVLSTFDGNRVEMQEWTRFCNPQIPILGHIFWDLPHLYNEILVALRKVADEGIELTSLGIDTWGVDFAFFGKDGQLLGLPYCYRDSHTDGAVERFFEQYMPARELYQRTGIQFMSFNSLFQLETLCRNGCEALDKAEKILFIPDALTYMLTGQSVCEQTILSTSQMMNPETGDIDEKLLGLLRLTRNKLGKLVQPGHQAGRLTEQVQTATGVGSVPVICVAGHDTASAVAAVPAEDGEYAYLSCGTWSLLGIESSHPIINEESFQYNFTNEGGLDGTTRFLKNICGLWLFENCRKEFKDVPADVNELNALCHTSSFNGLIQPDDPMFAHPDSMTAAIRQFCRQTGQAEPQSPADYVRCIFRSLALRYRQILEILDEMADFSIRKLHVIGGGSLNKHLMQWAADATNLPIIAGPAEGTALGNTLVQVRAAGGVDTLTEMRRIVARSVELKTYMPNHTPDWDEAYERFKSLNS
ncbi:MAG: rhamnulokinase [Bacteroidaceae bacterium]|nr:rhamnulokinase [Bacteroidaceae bacterium]